MAVISPRYATLEFTHTIMVNCDGGRRRFLLVMSTVNELLLDVFVVVFNFQGVVSNCSLFTFSYVPFLSTDEGWTQAS